MKLKVLILLLLLLNVSLFSQEKMLPCVAVLPLKKSSDDLQIEIISNNVRNTVELNLKMLNQYRIIQLENIPELNNVKLLSDCCLKNSIDYILFGTCSMPPGGGVQLQMSVYDRDKDSIIVTKTEKTKEVFDIFDASDRLAAEMIETFSGIHIGLGRISLENSGVIGRYSVYIDKIFIGDDITEIPKILSGERNISIIQERMSGEFLVKEDSVTVIEGENIFFRYSIPGILASEAEIIEKQEKIIDRYIKDINKKKKVEKAFNFLDTVLSETDYSSDILAKKKEIKLKKKEWLYFCVHSTEDKRRWLFPVSAGIHDDKRALFSKDDVEDHYSGATYQFGAGYQFFEKIYPAVSVEIYTGYDNNFAVPVPSIIVTENPDEFLQKYEFLIVPSGNEASGVFGIGFAFRHILLEAEIAFGSASSSFSAGYVLAP